MALKLLRHGSAKVTMDVYAQAQVPAKRAAQQKVVEMVRRDITFGTIHSGRLNWVRRWYPAILGGVSKPLSSPKTSFFSLLSTILNPSVSSIQPGSCRRNAVSNLVSALAQQHDL